MDKEIPRSDWSEFCASYGRQHRGWLVSIVSEAPGRVSKNLLENAPLRAIQFTDQTPGDEVSVLVGWEGSGTCVRLTEVDRLIVQSRGGAHVGLRLDRRAQGETTFIHFRVAATPEELDEISPAEQ